MSRCLVLLMIACSARPTAVAPALEGELRFEVAAIDRAVEPCTGFYDFACGGWRRTHPIPPDRARWSRYAELQTINLARERELVERAARAASTPAERRVGAYYAACLDQGAIDARGMAPLAELLAAIDAV